jgi:DNA polymerase-3 subunit delta'
MPFRDVIGHRRLLGLLARSIAADSLPPSLIFGGPAGVGKRLTATALAQALNCLDLRSWDPTAPDTKAPGTKASSTKAPSTKAPSTKSPSTNAPKTLDLTAGVDACGVCAACTRIARSVHPDTLVVEPGDNGSIKIDQVREAIDRTGYRPFEGRRRVVVIDEADALVPPAQNALLKTLEEPPPSSVFVLVTSRPDMLLPTVRSRCPQLRFRQLSTEEIVRGLVARRIGQAEAQAVAASADGSLGRALAASAEDLLAAREVAHRVLAHAASTPEPRRRIEGAKELLSNTGAGGATDRDQLSTHLRAMASLLRDIELLATVSNPDALANADVRQALERLTPTFRGDRGLNAFHAVDRALVALDRNASPKIVADWLVLEL